MRLARQRAIIIENGLEQVGENVIERLRLKPITIVCLLAVILAAGIITTWTIATRNSGAGIIISSDPTIAEIAVDVRGEVVNPGMYRLTGDARLADVLTAAGGTTPNADLAQFNLAERIIDGSQIVIPSINASPVAAPTIAVANTHPTAAPMSIGVTKISLNSATATELEALPGIGPVLAARIVDWRTSHGPFASIDELDAIDGISAALITKIQPFVTLDP